MAYKLTTDIFFWHPQDRSFTQEASTLGSEVMRGMLSRLYDDACDQGFMFISSRTGKSIAMYLHEEERDREGELLLWEFRPVNEQNAPFHHLTVFND